MDLISSILKEAVTSYECVRTIDLISPFLRVSFNFGNMCKLLEPLDFISLIFLTSFIFGKK